AGAIRGSAWCSGEGESPWGPPKPAESLVEPLSVIPRPLAVHGTSTSRWPFTTWTGPPSQTTLIAWSCPLSALGPLCGRTHANVGRAWTRWAPDVSIFAACADFPSVIAERWRHIRSAVGLRSTASELSVAVIELTSGRGVGGRSRPSRRPPPRRPRRRRRGGARRRR